MARRRRTRKEDGGFNVWRSYSDMMAGVLLLFVLIMCVTLFQAQRNYVEKLAEQEQRIRLQDEYAAEMAKKQAELEEQDALLTQQKEKLDEQNLTLDEMQAALEEQARILSEKQATLEEQETVLAQQRATMEEQQTTMAEQREALDAQQSMLDAQQSTLDAQQSTLEEQQNLLNAQADEINSKTQQLKDKQAQIDRIVGVKAEVIEALKREFAANNVNVKIDEQTGALMLDANVMFDYDSAQLSEDGQEVLYQVLPIYCHVLLSEQYRENVAEIIIDGYTDTDGTYDYNLELSQMRSLAVAQYLLATEGEFLDENDSQTLHDILTVNGHSWSNPILDAEGNINMEASRRVEVKFRLKDEEMIEELRNLTE